MAVSAALGAHHGNVRLSEATKLRIQEAARTLDYSPNILALSFRQRKTNVIGFYCGYGFLDARSQFLAEVIGGLQEECNLLCKDLLLHGVYRGSSVEDIYRECVGGKMDGLILQAAPNDPLVERLRESHLPVVAVVDAVPGLPSVVADDVAGSGMIARYLQKQGSKRIVYFERVILPRLESVERRRIGFEQEANRHGLQVDYLPAQEDIIPVNAPLPEILTLPAGERPDTLIGWSDRTAYDLISRCVYHGMRVPEDVRVIGFDGLGTPLDCLARLTSVRAPWAEVSRTAVSLLMKHIQGEEIAIETVLPVELLIGTTG